MDDLQLVCVHERLSNGDRDRQRFTKVESPLAPNTGLQRFARNVLESEIGQVAVDAIVVQFDDRRVLQASNELRLASKEGRSTLVCTRRVQGLDRHAHRRELEIERLVYRSKSASAQLLNDLEA